MAKHPGSDGERSYLLVHGEDDLWVIDAASKTVERALSGDWEHDVVPLVLDEGKAKRLADGKDDCPLARSGNCDKLGDETIAGQAVDGWRRGNRSYWLSPALRVAMRVEYAPFRNNPETQRAELSDVEIGAQDEALFKVPADYTCDSGTFCDSVPR
jgi:hypothetical protein